MKQFTWFLLLVQVQFLQHILQEVAAFEKSVCRGSVTAESLFRNVSSDAFILPETVIPHIKKKRKTRWLKLVMENPVNWLACY